MEHYSHVRMEAKVTAVGKFGNGNGLYIDYREGRNRWKTVAKAQGRCHPVWSKNQAVRE